MPRETGADDFVVCGRLAAASVACNGARDALEMIKDRFHSPEASAREDDLLGRLSGYRSGVRRRRGGELKCDQSRKNYMHDTPSTSRRPEWMYGCSPVCWTRAW